MRPRAGLARLWSPGLEEFLLAPADPTSAAVFRIALAAMLAVAFWPDTRLGGSDDAWPFAAPYASVLVSLPYTLAVLALLVLVGLGWRPRLVGMALAAMLLPLASQDGHRLGRHVLLMSRLAFCLLRSDARLSVLALRGHAPADAGPLWPIRLIQLQLSTLYLVNAVAKSTLEYLSGDVLVGFARVLPTFVADLADGHVHLGPIRVPVGLAATASVATEYALALGFWVRPLRILTAVLGVAFHLILRRMVQVHLAGWVSMFLYAAFLVPFDRATRQAERPSSPDASS